MLLTPASIGTVATIEVVREAHVAILALRHFYPFVPVYVITDHAGAIYLRECGLHDVCVKEVEFTKPGLVVEHNTYHRADAISMKMEVMSWALSRHADTLFFDADVAVVAPLTGFGPSNAEVWLSHNLAETPDASVTVAKFGMFNAGLVWSNNKQFPKWWADRYHTGTGFYEQGALNKVPGRFRCAYFDLCHNYGFWRGEVDKTYPRSFHVHLDHQRMDAKLTDYMRPKTQVLRHHAWLALSKCLPEIHKQARAILGHPRRVLFAHYGKAGGIYTNLALKAAFRGYDVRDSWADKLDRDWTAEEMFDILVDSPDFTYAHQHHHGLTTRLIDLAVAAGWDIVSFYRDPQDLVCSLYYWAQMTVRSEGRNYVLPDEDPHALLPFDDFWMRMMKPDMSYQWRKPDWWPMVQHGGGMFSHEALDAALIRLVGYPHIAAHPRNVSGNPGPQALIKSGMLTPELLAAMESAPHE